MKRLLIAPFILIASLSACTTQPTSTNTGEEDIDNALGELFGKQIKPDMTEVEKYPLGSEKNPVRVSMPVGERDYLARLICSNGEQVSAFARSGSGDLSPYGSMMDIYTVICDTDKGAVEHTVFMDMYHANYVENRPAHEFKALTQK